MVRPVLGCLFFSRDFRRDNRSVRPRRWLGPGARLTIFKFCSSALDFPVLNIVSVCSVRSSNVEGD